MPVAGGPQGGARRLLQMPLDGRRYVAGPAYCSQSDAALHRRLAAEATLTRYSVWSDEVLEATVLHTFAAPGEYAVCFTRDGQWYAVDTPIRVPGAAGYALAPAAPWANTTFGVRVRGWELTAADQLSLVFNTTACESSDAAVCACPSSAAVWAATAFGAGRCLVAKEPHPPGGRGWGHSSGGG